MAIDPRTRQRWQSIADELGLPFEPSTAPPEAPAAESQTAAPVAREKPAPTPVPPAVERPGRAELAPPERAAEVPPERGRPGGQVFATQETRPPEPAAHEEHAEESDATTAVPTTAAEPTESDVQPAAAAEAPSVRED